MKLKKLNNTILQNNRILIYAYHTQCFKKYRAAIKYATLKTTSRIPTIRRGNRSSPKRFAETHEITRASQSQLLDA